MKIYSIIFIFLNFCSFSQVDSVFLAYGLNHKFLLNTEMCKSLNGTLKKNKIHLDYELRAFSNFYSNVYYYRYRFTKSICGDTTCDFGVDSYYYVTKIVRNDTDIYASYINPFDKTVVFSNQELFNAFIIQYNEVFNVKFNDSKFIEGGNVYLTNLGTANAPISDELRNIINAIKKNNFKYLLALLKGPFPEEKLYGLLGVEILKQKNKKISSELLKYYDLSKKTSGLVNTCRGDQCAWKEFQVLLNKQPDFAKEIIRLYDIK